MNIRPAPALETFETFTVAPDHIDQFGHLNALVYRAKSEALAASLCARHGVQALRLHVADIYLRFRREQRLGDRLEVRGGLLSADETKLRTYCEIVNPVKGEIAAIIVQSTGALDSATGALRPLFPRPSDIAAAPRIDWPPETRPRSLSIGPPREAPSLARLADADRLFYAPFVVKPEDCDADGLMAPRHPLQIFFGGVPEALHPMGLPAFEHFARGIGWAMLEVRMLTPQLPRLGDRLQASFVDIALADKTRHWAHLCHNVETGACVAVSANVTGALDLKARTAISIPGDIRALIGPRLRPEFSVY